MPQSRSEPTWTLHRRSSLALRTWAGETVVYDSLPGSTHLLDPVSSAVVGFLRAQDGSASDIARAMSNEFEADAEEDVLGAVQAALAKLRDAGLIQPTEE